MAAAGSGIGPCLDKSPHMFAILLRTLINLNESMFVDHPDHDFKIVWSTREPLRTYGTDVHNMILRANPTATITNIDREGRKDVASLAENKVHETRAEAVIVISNKPKIDKVVHEMSKLRITCLRAYLRYLKADLKRHCDRSTLIVSSL